MGGICGYLGDLNLDIVKTMQQTLRAGSAESSVYSDRGAAVCSLDSRTGGVASMDGSMLACEGQIWNMKELSRAIVPQMGEIHPAELLLHMITQNKLELLPRIKGNFALAFCNHQRNEIILARDKVGHLPLYYAVYGGFVLFASRITGILSTKLVPKSLNLTGLDYYLSFGHIPARETLFKNVLRLPAATVVRLQNAQWRSDRYWQVEPRPNLAVTQEEWATRLHDTLDEILIDYLNKSETPAGIFLSGIDSSILSALILKRLEGRLVAFTAAFEDEAYNELLARDTAEFLGLDYHEVSIGADDVPNVLPKLVLAYDDLLSEHLGSFPTFMLASKAAGGVKTLFTGDGAGLIFSESEPEQRICRLSRALPASVREQLVEYPFTSVHSVMFRQPLRLLDAMIKEAGMRCSTAARVFYGQLIFRPHERFDLYDKGLGERIVTNTFLPMRDLVQVAKDEACRPDEYLPNVFRFKTRMADTWGFYIPRVERISAYFSLSSWLPYLDERTLELAAMVPQKAGSAGETKTVLRHLATKFNLLPPHIINQRKRGMQSPLPIWMKLQLKEYFEKTIDDGITRTHRLFERSKIKKIARKGDPRKILALAMLFLWIEQYFPEKLDL